MQFELAQFKRSFMIKNNQLLDITIPQATTKVIEFIQQSFLVPVEATGTSTVAV